MINFMLSISQKTIFIFSLGMVLGMVFVGLYPFNYSPSNQVSILRDGAGIRFFGRGEAVSIKDTVWPLADYSGQPITLEIRLKPARTYYRWIPHILSLCDRSGREVVYFGQWKNHLIIRLMDDSHWVEKIKREIGSSEALIPGKHVLITFVLQKGSASLYINGQLDRKFTGFDFETAISSHPIRSFILGNSPLGNSPWRGDVMYFSVFDKALDPTVIQDHYQKLESGKVINPDKEIIRYRFNEIAGRTILNEAGDNWELLIPEDLTPQRRKFLSLPSRQFFQTSLFYKDAAINLLGFMPLGFFLSMFVNRSFNQKHFRALALATIVGGTLSLFIEVNQVFLVSRSSSATDLVLNILGTAAGASVVILYSHFQELSPY